MTNYQIQARMSMGHFLLLYLQLSMTKISFMVWVKQTMAILLKQETTSISSPNTHVNARDIAIKDNLP